MDRELPLIVFIGDHIQKLLPWRLEISLSSLECICSASVGSIIRSFFAAFVFSRVLTTRLRSSVAGSSNDLNMALSASRSLSSSVFSVCHFILGNMDRIRFALASTSYQYQRQR